MMKMHFIHVGMNANLCCTLMLIMVLSMFHCYLEVEDKRIENVMRHIIL